MAELHREEWRVIPRYPNYEASSLGRIRGQRGIRRPATRPDGYMRLDMWIDGRSKNEYVNRLILEAFEGEAPPAYQASHLDGNRSNNRIDNLAWESASDNSLRKRSHGTSGKLSEEDKAEIKRLRSLGISGAEVATLFSVSHAAVSMIKNDRAAYGRVAP